MHWSSAYNVISSFPHPFPASRLAGTSPGGRKPLTEDESTDTEHPGHWWLHRATQLPPDLLWLRVSIMQEPVSATMNQESVSCKQLSVHLRASMSVFNGCELSLSSRPCATSLQYPNDVSLRMSISSKVAPVLRRSRLGCH